MAIRSAFDNKCNKISHTFNIKRHHAFPQTVSHLCTGPTCYETQPLPPTLKSDGQVGGQGGRTARCFRLPGCVRCQGSNSQHVVPMTDLYISRGEIHKVIAYEK